MTYELGVIGCGAMGWAILSGAIDANIIEPDRIIVAEPDEARRERPRAAGCAVTVNPRETLTADRLLLAVKPQVFPDVAGAIGSLRPDVLVLSIMAGISSTRIQAALGGGGRVVRVMPNMPCQVRAGMAAIAPGVDARAEDMAFASNLFQALGKTVVVEEHQLDAVTALSGSGPAYVFLLAESLEQAGVRMGLEPAVARLLAYQTVFGAGTLLHEDGREAEALRQAVTSSGGTTAAALAVMFEQELPRIVVEAVTAARARGRELNAG